MGIRIPNIAYKLLISNKEMNSENSPFNRGCYFIGDKAMFGAFPTQEEVLHLERIGFRYFIDLTSGNEEHTEPYRTVYNYINYPIPDHNTPQDWLSFAKFIITLCDILRSDMGKILIHCRGGHGRSGLVAASVLCYYYQIHPSDAVRITSRCHAQRPELRAKWRLLGSPARGKQRDFVFNFFKPLKYDNRENIFYPFSDLSEHSVTTPQGTFSNLSSALENNNDIDFHYEMLKLKFNQHPELKNLLLSTGLRQLKRTSSDEYWGVGDFGDGQNMHGRLLMKLREELIFGMHRNSLFEVRPMV